MFGWGIALLVVGLLSFAMPLFDRQFILVTLLGLTGVGPSVAGIIFCLVGAVLLMVRNQSQETVSDRRPTAGPPATNELDRGASSRSTSATAEAIQAPSRDEPSTGEELLGDFTIDAGRTYSPHDFGVEITVNALRASADALEAFGDRTKLQQRIKAKSAPAQLHLLSLQIAVFYLLANDACDRDQNVLSEVGRGISNGLTRIFGPSDLVEFAYNLTLADYAQMLSRDRSSEDDSNPFRQGETATTLGATLVAQYQAQELVAANASELVMLELLASSVGIRQLVALTNSSAVEYWGPAI